MPDDLAHSIGATVRHHLDRRAGDLAQVGAAAGDGDDLLSTEEVARWLRVSTQFLEICRHKGRGPKYVRLSTRRTRYLRSSVIEWLRERQYQATAEYSRPRHSDPEPAAPPPQQPTTQTAVSRTPRFVRRAP
jgi:predicted DNA-binding transcriptional regulator AlpA